MKNLLLKSFGILALILAIFITVAHAQTHPKTYPITTNVNQGTFLDFGGINMIPRDSLLVTDTARYIIPITHTNDLSNYLAFNWLKIGAGTATLKINFYQGNDPVNFFTVKAGKTQAAYVKNYTLAASALNEISFIRDTAFFEGRYLKVELITSSTASVKGKYAFRIKTNYK